MYISARRHACCQILLVSILALGTISCVDAAPRRTTPDKELRKIDEVLSQWIRSYLSEKDLIFETKLWFAQYIDTDQYRNTRNVTNPGGLQAPRHEFFILTDSPFPIDHNRSVLRAYETIVKSANCLSNEFNDDPGCILLRDAKDDLRLPSMPASQFRQGWPDWRPVGANPENWGEKTTTWTPLKLQSDGLEVETEYLYVKLSRGWFSEDFLKSSGWYISGQCGGWISDGNPDNNAQNRDAEFLPQIPVGILLTRKLTITLNGMEIFGLAHTHLSGWVLRAVPLSPQIGDPGRKDCPISSYSRHEVSAYRLLGGNARHFGDTLFIYEGLFHMRTPE